MNNKSFIVYRVWDNFNKTWYSRVYTALGPAKAVITKNKNSSLIIVQLNCQEI